MRFVAEYLENTAQLLLRFLSEPAVPGDIVQTGTYVVDGTPQIPAISNIEITSDDIKDGESHAYFTGYWPLPTHLDITLPDLTTQRVSVVQVVQNDAKWEPTLINQPIDAIKPIEPEERRPAEGRRDPKSESTIPPEYPTLWVEIALERSDPVRIGEGMISDPLIYVGGCEGRALSSTVIQSAPNAPPYASYAPVRLEGQFSNSLPNSNFAISPSWPSPHFDHLPDGWSVNLADPMSIIRMQTSDPNAVLPTFTLKYRQRTGSDVSAIPPVTILTPEIVNAGETFQVIVAPNPKNDAGRIQLKTIDDVVASPYYNLMGEPIIATLPIGTHTGRVKIIWDQTKGDGEEQVIQLIAPCSSVYTGAHSYIPTGKTSFADVLTLENIEFDKPWYFNKGSIRVDGSGEDPTQPFSWKVTVGAQILLKVDSGILSSDFMLQPAVSLAAYLPSVLSYKLVWSSLTSFKLVDQSGLTSVDIPFSLDLTAIAGTLDPLRVELTGYKPVEGSSLIQRWSYLPS